MEKSKREHLISGMRDEVSIFAHNMEENLKKHDELKGEQGWLGCEIEHLMVKLTEEVGELSTAIQEKRHFDVIGEAADVGNMAMMIAEVAKENGNIFCLAKERS